MFTRHCSLSPSMLFALLLLLICSALPASAAPTAQLYYTGTLGGKYPVQMDLTWRGKDIYGSYLYTSVGEKLHLAGRQREKDAAAFSETGAGNITGTFTGRFSADRRQFAGTWTSANGKRQLTVALTAIAAAHTVKRKLGKLTLVGSYPVFFNPTSALKTLSGLLRQRAATALQSYDLDEADTGEIAKHDPEAMSYDISIAYFRPNLVSLLISDYEDTGGAHPNTTYKSANYMLDADKPHLLALGQLFNARTPYKQALTELVVADLNKQIAQRDFKLDSPLTPDKLTTYTLGPKAITFVFSPYEVACYAAGDFFVSIPYEKLKDYLKIDGPLPALLPAGKGKSR